MLGAGRTHHMLKLETCPDVCGTWKQHEWGPQAIWHSLLARSCDADSQPRFPEHFSSTSSLPIDTTTPVAMFTQTLRASVRAILSFRCIKTNSCSAPRSPALRGSKLPAWSRDEPSSLLLPCVKVRGSFIFQQMV